jgi:hypothetical protein
MPKHTVPAAGEAMPAANQTPTRRRLFAIAGNASAAVAATTALARPTFAMSAAEFVAGSAADPIFAAIEEHRRAVAFAYEPGIAEEEFDRRASAEYDVLWRALEIEPTTIAGARRLLEHVAAYDDGLTTDPQLPLLAIRTVAAALAKMEARHV